MADQPGGFFSDAGQAVRRLRAAGASHEDIAALARFVAFDSAYSVLYALNGGQGQRHAATIEDFIDHDRYIQAEAEGPFGSLHELLLWADPSGREGRP